MIGRDGVSSLTPHLLQRAVHSTFGVRARHNRMRIRWILAAVLLMCQGPGTTCFAVGTTTKRSTGAPAAAASAVLPLARTRSQGRAAATLMAANDGAAPGPRSQATAWFVRNRSLILLICLILHKCASDILTRYTRVQGAYSINTVAM